MTGVVFWRTTPAQRWRVALYGSALGALFLGLPEPFEPWWLPALVGAAAGAPIGYLIAPPQYTRLMDSHLEHVQKDNNLSTSLNKLTSVRREFVPYADPNIVLMFGQRRVPITTDPSSSELRKAIWDAVSTRADFATVAASSDEWALRQLRDAWAGNIG
jgi:hypothetical protein